MPWYDFQCESCGNVFELQRAMNETRKAKCKSCGSTRTVKIYSAAGISFKGGGFYATDSRSAAPAAGDSTGSNSSTPESTPAPAAAEKSTAPKPPGTLGEKASA